MEVFFTSAGIIALLTLTFLEIVLGIDNIIFISVVTSRLPAEEQARARKIGLVLALFMRIILLLFISVIIGFSKPLFTLPFIGTEISGRDLILMAGGIFLLVKSVLEVHKKVEMVEHHEDITESTGKKMSKLGKTIVQIIILDMVFSFDSILTAIGLSRELPIMIAAVIISMIIMLLFSAKISDFINNHPTLQILALSFLILIGFMLMIDALHYEVPKGYIYFAVLFSFSVEMLNMRYRKKKSAATRQ